LCDLLNKIIWIGGTPAFDTPLTVAEFEEYFLTGPNFVTCYLGGDSNSGLFFEFREYLDFWTNRPPWRKRKDRLAADS